MDSQLPSSNYGPPAARSAPPNTSLLNLSLLLLLLVGFGTLLGFFAASWRMGNRGPTFDPNAAPRPVAPAAALASDEQATIDLFKASSNSVVYITTVAVRRDAVNFNPVEIPRGTGSGFVWDESGHIVTNFHVVSGAVGRNDRIRVTLADRNTHQAHLVGVAPDNDIAVLQLDAPPSQLTPLRIGTSHDLLVGQKVLAIGNPFGLDQTLTTGVISGLGREIRAESGRNIYDVIQTDAAINPGNSGGPLLDSSGRLIGMNTAIYSPSGAYAGIGFAIPVDTINRVVPQLLRHGQVTRPGFGIQIANDQIVKQLGVEGVLVLRVAEGGAAQEAGFRPTEVDAEENIELGDVIVAIDDVPIRSSDDLFKVLDHHEVGDVVTVKLLRNARTPREETLETSVTLKPL
jgi:S1-C subfamily serine protease